MTKTHTGTTDWTDVTPDRDDISIDGVEGGVELVCHAANTGVVLYADQPAAPTLDTQGFPVRLDNPTGIFIPASTFLGSEKSRANKLWVKLSVSGDKLGIRSY